LHFANTLLLLAALALTANWLRNESSSFRLAGKLRELAFLGVGLVASMVIESVAQSPLSATLYFPQHHCGLQCCKISVQVRRLSCIFGFSIP